MADNAKAQVDALRKRFVQLYEQGDYRAALQLAEQDFHLSIQVLDPNHPDVALSMSNLATAY